MSDESVKEPNAEQLQALRAFARNYGTRWKEELAERWLDGRDAQEPNGHLLRQLRNRLGPRWLKDFKLEVRKDDEQRTLLDEAEEHCPRVLTDLMQALGLKRHTPEQRLDAYRQVTEMLLESLANARKQLEKERARRNAPAGTLTDRQFGLLVDEACEILNKLIRDHDPKSEAQADAMAHLTEPQPGESVRSTLGTALGCFSHCL